MPPEISSTEFEPFEFEPFEFDWDEFELSVLDLDEVETLKTQSTTALSPEVPPIEAQPVLVPPVAGQISLSTPSLSIVPRMRTTPPLMPWPLTPSQMRPWQTQAFNTVARSWLQIKDENKDEGKDINQKDMDQNALVVGTPGAGKTDLGLMALHSALQSKHADRAVVVVPTSGLKQQWVEAAQRKGITLTANWTNDQNGPEPADTHGMVVTYAQVAADPEASRRLMDRPTFVLFDEIHHAGQHSGWGEALQRAFGAARFRLGLSGTPFRSDNSAIPFVRYVKGRCQPDYAYGYSEGLRDGVCRPLIFPSYEGDLCWIDGARTRQATFDSLLDAPGSSRRLRTALDPLGDWLPSVLKAADAKLTELRLSGHPEAGGLILCMDQKHALATANLVRQITGTMPAVAVSDDPDSASRVRAFRSSSDRWLVSVRMVSEGVDIPRLRVGVYATNIVAELFFRQAIGRFVRVQPGLTEQSAYVYVPRDLRLIRLVTSLQEERGRALRMRCVFDEETLEGTEFARRSGTNRAGTKLGLGLSAASGLFLPLSSRAVESSMYSATTGGDRSYQLGLVTAARALKAMSATLNGLPETTIAEILRLSGHQLPHALPPVPRPARSVSARPLPATATSAALSSARSSSIGSSSAMSGSTQSGPTQSGPTHDEESRRLKAKCSQLAARLDRERGVPVGTSHGDWLRETGLRQKGATHAVLRSKLHWLQNSIVRHLDQASNGAGL